MKQNSVQYINWLFLCSRGNVDPLRGAYFELTMIYVDIYNRAYIEPVIVGLN